MGRSREDLAAQLWPANLQEVQDAYSYSLGIPILFVDASGRPLTACEDLSEFCRRFTRAICLDRPCLDCGRGRQPVQVPGPGITVPGSRSFVHVCPLGLVDAAVPVVSAGEVLGHGLTAQRIAADGACLASRDESSSARGAEECLALLHHLPSRCRAEMEQAAAGLSALAWLVGALAAARRRNLRLSERVREQGRLIGEQAVTDAVTGLANRRHFCSAVEAEVLRVRRYQRDLSLAVLDIQGFHRINEEFGYDIGDLALREVGHCLSCTVRQTDLVGRIGGDEFGLLLPETARPEAMIALARVVAQVEDLNASGELPVEIRLAVGLADQTAGLDAMLSEAYRALARGLTSVG